MIAAVCGAAAAADDLAAAELVVRGGNLFASVKDELSVTAADGSTFGVVANARGVSDLGGRLDSVSAVASGAASAVEGLVPQVEGLVPRVEGLHATAANLTNVTGALRQDVDGLAMLQAEEAAALQDEVSALKRYNQQYGLLLATLLGGTDKSVPVSSCRQVGLGRDGTYWLKGAPDGEPFQAFCEQSEDGGGWTKVVHYKGDRYVGPIESGRHKSCNIFYVPPAFILT